jgi:tetratricopeptide (TPR) repeat protein
VPRSPAERLFLERARAVRPNFASDPLDQAVVADICRRLEGLPLAIELAASRARSMGPQTLLDALGQRLDLLSAGPADFSPRQRSIRGALDWSYELLDDPERRFFSRMSVFAGGATLDAIVAVCGEAADESAAVLTTVDSLAQKSLLYVREVASATRFRMLQTIREYAHQHLLAREGSAVIDDVLRKRHALHYAGLAEGAVDGLSSPQQIEWSTRLDADRDNFRAALDWALQQQDAELAGRLCAALWRFWRARGYFHEGRRWFSAVLPLRSRLVVPTRAAVLNGAGVMALVQSDYAMATGLLEESRDLYLELRDRSGTAFVLSNLGIVAHDTSDADRAQALFEESLRLRRELDERSGEAAALNNLGMIALERDLAGEARTLFQESAELFRGTGELRGLAQALSNLGWATQELGEYDRATQLYTESLTLVQKLADARAIASNVNNLALMALYRGDYATARELFTDSLVGFHDLGYKRGVAQSLEGLAGVVGVQGRPEEAARLFGLADAIREAVGAPLLPTDRSRSAATLAAAREQLDADTWDRAWSQGRAMPLEEAIAALLG